MKKEIQNMKDLKKSVLAPLIHVNEKDIISKPNCKLCNNPLRFEAEKYWEENDFNFSKTLRWINERVEDYNVTKPDDMEEMESFSMANLNNHMKNHFREQERQLRLKEYAKSIESLLASKQDKMDVLDFALAACQENLARVASVETHGSAKGEISRADAINKVIKQMLDVVKTQKDMMGEISAIDIVQEKVAQIWIQMIGDEDNEAKKRIYVKMLEEFSERFKELEGNG